MSDGWILKALLYNVLPMLLWKMIYGRLSVSPSKETVVFFISQK